MLFCSSSLLFSTSYWCVEWVGVISICPHPPAFFRIRVECHFLPLFPRLPPSKPSQTLLALSTQPYSTGCVVGSHLATEMDTFYETSWTIWIWVCLICFLLRTYMKAVSNTDSVKVHYPWAESVDSSASCSINPDDLLNDSANCLVKLHTAALACSFFRDWRTGNSFCLALYALWWMAGQWLLYLSTVTDSFLDSCLYRLGMYCTWGWVQWKTACVIIAALKVWCGYWAWVPLDFSHIFPFVQGPGVPDIK